MRKLLKFHRRYFILAALALVVEILIALFVHDRVIRPYVGDILVVVLIYCAVKAFLDTPVLFTALSVLLFAFVIEALQYFNFVDRVGLQHSALAVTIIGNSFAWIDVMAYIAGFFVILLFEKRKGVHRLKTGTEVLPN